MQPSERPEHSAIVSAQPPPGFVVLKGNGWRVHAPLALVSLVLGALATRLVSTEQRLIEQAHTIEVLALHCPPVKP